MSDHYKLVLSNPQGLHITYRQLLGNKASIIFFGGFNSNMQGTKATALYDYCKSHNLGLILFDYLGHGQSDGQFTDYNISDWYKNCIEIITQLTPTNRPKIIIGSSMGAWLMLLVAISHQDKVSHLISLAGAPDFTESLIFQKLNTQQKDELYKYGQITLSQNSNNMYSYVITRNLIEDGRKHLLLNQESINITCPITLIHGMNDDTVPYQTSITVAEKIKSDNVNLHLIKSANHNLSDDTSLNIIFKYIKEAVEQSIQVK
ncbi:phospholipase/Carboxylesterase family protein [Ehrlichia chaffeensis str. Heartland]|uniref:Hydrolase, alpha/beta fold family n=1 Tax=Ehrlichia chaffeensis (strain ATCC CRL-10679 / Arkansas) TaxID=205920 RepID=Q2GHD7_EHRCR|nr:alpha/beta hydrolase [Ehrlichia chaffeensis]ABD44752.1 hydrolase, alpha/beta fold family [Ehrlichia chaffeensis str. Arkansas]AHX03439.1 phospholipase/Carboxylesterase family protein [Ehrlichia chaffeensis str. Heartland]AHX05840.1 phospholipase/Carboxylesterase family protein [Ehrlichia chaffeensis str. Jax]AHX06832.1 phospholipase/Carboxylesterase family protein [Ehrlichia chaffeensis str. Liberty]AHX08038.1 phospholipase/Carboxylesterase family protein [Ehrlichia chaffeensis str. Osceola